MIKIGDRVKFINDVGAGIVRSINKEIVNVEVENGFIVPTIITELVAVAESEELEAISRIGVSDPRPGIVRKAATEKKERDRRKESSASRFGKISLVSFEDEDEEIIDISAMKSQYLKKSVAVNELYNEAEKRKNIAIRSEYISKEEVVKEPEKMRSVTLEELAQSSGIKHIADIKKDKKISDIEIIDLHAEEILDSTAGMSSGEILVSQISRFTIALDLAIKSGRHGKIVFIHGVGKGKLKYEIQKVLDKNYPKLSYQDASFKEYGYGAIMVFY